MGGRGRPYKASVGPHYAPSAPAGTDLRGGDAGGEESPRCRLLEGKLGNRRLENGVRAVWAAKSRKDVGIPFSANVLISSLKEAKQGTGLKRLLF